MPSPIDVAGQRLHNQKLARADSRAPEDVVSWLGAVQAQDYPGATWALALRLKGATEASVEQAFNEGRILRTHILRPTWHFIGPRDIRWMLALTGPRVLAASASYFRQLELDERTLARGRSTFERALRGGKQLTRLELAAALRRAGIEATGQRLAYFVLDAELRAIICSGPRRGKQFTYMLLEERAAPAPPLTREAALAELTRRYFASHGPATVRDFSWWSGLRMSEVREAVALLGDALAHDVIDGLTYWFVPSKTSRPAPAAYLLPNYDEYGIAYKDRGFIMDPRRPIPPNSFMNGYPHMLVSNGTLAGSWKRTFSKNAALIEVKPFGRFTRDERLAIDEQIARHSRFLGMPVELAYA